MFLSPSRREKQRVMLELVLSEEHYMKTWDIFIVKELKVI